ncbi:MAG: hypothetical protein ACRDBG_12980 [Waterburya sp.]
MAQVSRLNGFRPVKMITGAPYTGAANVYFVPAADATVIMVGDLVKFGGDARAATGVATVTRAAAGDAILGVVVGILLSGIGDAQNIPPVADLNTPVFRRASTDRYLLVADDPNLILESQVSAAGSFATADVGLNVNFRGTAGNIVSGASGMDVDITTKATTATLPLKIMGFQQRPDNVVGDPFISVLVAVNNHQLKGGTGTLGV